MTRKQLLHALLAERFGPLAEVAKEVPPTALEMTRRRLVLIGREVEAQPLGDLCDTGEGAA